jgi:competence protein ComEC
MIAWICLHLLVSHTSPLPDKTTITFYSVGHGLAVLMEFPDETRMLYDCGSHDGGAIAADAVLGDLRERGIAHLHRVYLSHADLDHYSALPDLIGEIETSRIISTDAVIGSKETNLINLRRNLRAAGCELRPVEMGTRERISEEVSIEVLHPPRGIEFSSDNAASLVLHVRCQGVGILLTGDLEAEGLWSLFGRDALDTDILLAPHHGSLAANPGELSTWCRPRYVVISSGHRVKLRQLERIYSRSRRVLCTERDGAVRFSISAEGNVSIETFRETETGAGNQ